jgi:hypothetical protein
MRTKEHPATLGGSTEINVAATHTRRLASFCAGAGLVAAVGLVLWATGALGHDGHERDSSSPMKSSNDSIAAPIKEGEPCVGARSVPLNKLGGLANVPVWQPHPKDLQLTGAWTCIGDTPVLSFGDVNVFYEAGWGGVDVKAKWASLAKDLGGTVEDINGTPAYVEPVANGSTKPQIMLVHGDTLVRVLGAPKSDISELRDIAASIDFEKEALNRS